MAVALDSHDQAPVVRALSEFDRNSGNAFERHDQDVSAIEDGHRHEIQNAQVDAEHRHE